MSREQALNELRFAGYHGDKKTLVRIRVECRVSWEACAKAYNEGERMRANGMRCNCFECRTL